MNVGDDKVYRWYKDWINGLPTLRVTAARAEGLTVQTPVDPQTTGATRLYYYGPHVQKNGQLTFTYIPAAAVLGAQIDGEAGAKKYGIAPEMFKGKIVILCATALGTYDLKSSPLSAEYPGPEVQATAIENLLRHDRVAHGGRVAGGDYWAGFDAAGGGTDCDSARGDIETFRADRRDSGVAGRGGYAVSRGANCVAAAFVAVAGDCVCDAHGVCVDVSGGGSAACGLC